MARPRQTAVHSADPDYSAALRAYSARRFEEGLRAVEKHLARHPKSGVGFNLKGVLLNQLERGRDALEALKEAERLIPQSHSPPINLAKAYLALGETGAAIEACKRALRRNPKEVEALRYLARARQQEGDVDGALAVMRSAVMVAPNDADNHALMARLHARQRRYPEAIAAIERALQFKPEIGLRLERALLWSQSGRQKDALADVEALLREHPDHAEVLRFLGEFHLFQHNDFRRANEYLRRSAAIAPTIDVLTSLVWSLTNSRYDDEGKFIDEAYGFACKAQDSGRSILRMASTLYTVFERAADFARIDRIDLQKALAYWAANNAPSSIQGRLSNVKTPQDRRTLLGWHRKWGEQIEAQARRAPITPPVRAPRQRIRVGLMSADLRNHPVTYFALPLFDHLDRDRFELFAYSFFTEEPDEVQRYLAERSTFRVIPGSNDRDIAQRIAGDDLDVLFELGGATHLNRLGVMAYRPAPIQASWLGYPHSVGLSTIDYILVDPYLKPAPDLLIEKPFEMPKTWVALSRLGFDDRVTVAPDPPSDRNGFVTFGTANNPRKYTAELIALWARVLIAVPGSHFFFVRPEGASVSFRANILAEFAKHGVSADRIRFEAVRGKHLPFYGQMDIALDCVPHTGGTTTCEALWQGVPTVTRVGEAFFERLSHSNLNNAGLGDLSAADDDAFVACAVTLAADRDRRARLRRDLRAMLRASPLGDTKGFVEAWQERIAAIVKEGPA